MPGTYLVKEIFGPTIQGEGAHAGRACVFLRFAVCSLSCGWCDTDFRPEGARHLTAAAITDELLALDRGHSRLVIVTGGEPTLQWDAELAAALHSAGFAVHMESNGIRPPAAPVDWLTVSPKPQFHPPNLSLAVLSPSECKLVVDDTVDDARLDDCERRYAGCSSFFLQPCMDQRYSEHLARTLAFIERRPRWRLSLQIHKVVGVP